MRYLLSLFCIAALLSCSRPDKGITKVELKRIGAWQNKGITISIDSSRHYRFEYKYVNRDGEPKSVLGMGNVDRDLWYRLTRKIEAIDLDAIETAKGASAPDGKNYELTINWKKGTKQIVRMQSSDQKDPVTDLINWINDTDKRMPALKECIRLYDVDTTLIAANVRR